MKRLLFLILSAVTLFTVSCDKSEVDLIFGQTPEERVSERLDELRQHLVSAPNGWKGSLNVGRTDRGGYGFYFDFEDGQYVTMLSDINMTSGETPEQSTYRVTWAMNASLIFDTFNYITMLQEPSGNYGGVSPNGYQSDFEFEYIRSSEDSLFLTGKRYRQDFVLVKATSEEKAAFLEGKLNDERESLNAFLGSQFNNYIEIDGIANMIDISFNVANKLATFQYVNDSDEGVSSQVAKFHFEPQGIHFSQPITLNGITIIKGTVTSNSLILYDADGAAYEVKQHTSPIIPLEAMFNYNGVFRTIGTPLESNVLPEILTTSQFTAVWNNVVTNITDPNYARHFQVTLTNASTLTVTIAYQTASPFNAVMTFDYVYEDGYITLSNPSGNTSGNWNTRRAWVRPFEDYLLDIVDNNVRLKVEWIPAPGGAQIGGLIREDDSSSFIYGNVRF